jgi:hypothetical protein
MPGPISKPRTLYDKIWDDHLMYVILEQQYRFNTDLCPTSSDAQDDGLALIYIDRWVYSRYNPSMSGVSSYSL